MTQKASFKSVIWAIIIWGRDLWYFGNYVFFDNVAISVIFSSYFIITFDRNGHFEFWWFHRKDLVQIYQNIPFFELKILFYLYKSIFKGKVKNLRLFFLMYMVDISGDSDPNRTNRQVFVSAILCSIRFRSGRQISASKISIQAYTKKYIQFIYILWAW